MLVLKFISKVERFEVLLVLEKLSNEELNLEFLKLVIFVFYFLCLVNNFIVENVDRILCFFIVKNFIVGMVLLSFINEMFYVNYWKDENDCVCIVGNLMEIFVIFF